MIAVSFIFHRTVAVAFVPVLLACFGGELRALGSTAPLREAPQIVHPGDSGIGRRIPPLSFTPTKGETFQLADLSAASAVVLAFTSTSCPVSKRYVPTLAAMEREYGPRGVKFVFINPIPTDDPAKAPDAFSGPQVPDTGKRIAAALGARSTAEVFLLDRAGTLAYRGAIDDQYGLRYSLETPRSRHLSDALEAVLSGNPPPVASTTAPGCALEIPKGLETAKTPLTYHDRVSRILQQNCLQCHRTGGVAPFALERYEEVISHAGMIRKQVEKGVMPPWFAAPAESGESPWANDRTLSSEDKADLLAWLGGDRAEGNPAHAPLPRAYPADWEIGEPDAIVRIPTPLEVKATGVMPYQNVRVRTEFAEDRWVQEIEVRPTAREVVHHVLVFVVPPGQDGKPRQGGGGDNESGNFFAVYVPGNNVLRFPDGLAKFIPANSSLHFQIHYTPNGTATRDQTALGLKFSKTTPLHEVRVASIAAKIDIPPGESNYRTEGKVPVIFDAKLMSFMPHMHVRGKAYRYELVTPNGESFLLLEVPRYDFNWQIQYRLKEDLFIPAGSVLRGTAWYDNSDGNPANPDPTARVKWGEQTYEEMMLGYFEYYVPAVPAGERASLLEIALRDGGVVFNNLDKNRDGVITIEESPTPGQFKQADGDGDGKVTREEFKEFWRKQARPREG